LTSKYQLADNVQTLIVICYGLSGVLSRLSFRKS